jgi:hypothetical protein
MHHGVAFTANLKYASVTIFATYASRKGSHYLTTVLIFVSESNTGLQMKSEL